MATENVSDLHERVAKALGWSVSDAQSFSMQALRDLVRPVDPDLAREMDYLIQSGAYIRGEPLATRGKGRASRGHATVARTCSMCGDEAAPDVRPTTDVRGHTANLCRSCREAEAAIDKDRQERGAVRGAAPRVASTYEGQLRYWDDYATKWGMQAARERANAAVAGGFLARDFGESAEAFYARDPAARATRDWNARNRR